MEDAQDFESLKNYVTLQNFSTRCTSYRSTKDYSVATVLLYAAHSS